MGSLLPYVEKRKKVEWFKAKLYFLYHSGISYSADREIKKLPLFSARHVNRSLDNGKKYDGRLAAKKMKSVQAQWKKKSWEKNEEPNRNDTRVVLRKNMEFSLRRRHMTMPSERIAGRHNVLPQQSGQNRFVLRESW